MNVLFIDVHFVKSACVVLEPFDIVILNQQNV